MPKQPKPKRTPPKKAPATRRPKLTFDERVVSRVGKRPIGRNQLAEKMGVPPQAVARALGQAHAQGKLVKTPKGYQKAI